MKLQSQTLRAFHLSRPIVLCAQCGEERCSLRSGASISTTAASATSGPATTATTGSRLSVCYPTPAEPLRLKFAIPTTQRMGRPRASYGREAACGALKNKSRSAGRTKKLRGASDGSS